MLKIFLLFISVSLLNYTLLALDRSLILKDMRTEGRTALIIGNSKYDRVPLKNPVNDAREMRNFLQTKGFDVVYGEDADRNTMYDLFDEYIAKVNKKGGVALFYFAGHGVGVKGENFLIPVNARIKKPRDIQRNAFSVDNILSSLDEEQTRLNILILDACRNNPFKGSRAASGGLATVNSSARGTFIAYATAPGKTASDGDGEHSVYTKYLLNNMNKEGLTIEQVFKHVRISVETDTNGVQTPWETSSLNGDFFFTLPSDKSTYVASSSAPIIASSAINNDRYFWEEIKDSASIVNYKAYLTQFPKGQYILLAQLKIDKINAKNIKYKLFIQTEPSDVKISFKNDEHIFEEGMQLPKGKYILVFEKEGYKPYEHKFLLNDNTKLTIPLKRDLKNSIEKKVYVTYIEPSLKLINPNTFTIGDKSAKGDKDEQVNKEITFKDSFYMGVYEVTLGEYDKYIDAYNLKKVNNSISGQTRDTMPVTNVSWDDANNYARWLSKVTGKNYKLPTEAQWEYVARAGANSLFYWGNKETKADMFAAYKGNAGSPYAIGTMKPNNWNFYDMSGNVWEWCEDSYSNSYDNLPTDGTAMKEINNKKVIRGGAWNSKSWTLRTSNRLYTKYNKKRSTIGFRLVMIP